MSVVNEHVKLLPIALFIFLAGCVNAIGGDQAGDLYVFKCTLPSQPGKVDFDLLYIPDSIVLDGDEAFEIIDGYLYNTIYLGEDTKPVSVSLKVSPLVGSAILEADGKSAEDEPLEIGVDPPEYYPDTGEILQSEKDFTITLKIPGQIADIGAMNFVISAEYSTESRISIPLCLGYDPASVKVSPDVRNCDPLNIPQACYSSSPIIPSSINVDVKGTSRNARYIVEITLSDEFNGLVEENNRRTVNINSISLIVDSKEFQEGGSVIKCTPSPDSKLYMDRVNKIVCRIYLDELKDQCGGSGCFVDDNSLHVGKGVLLDIKLSYDYRISKVYGPIGLEKLYS